MLSEDLEVQGIEFVGKLPENLIFEIDRSTPSMGKYQKPLNANGIQMTSDDDGSVVTATYSCTNIIKHYGTFATGHYVGPYCLEVKSGEWFQFVQGCFNAAEGAPQDKGKVGVQNEVAVVYIYTKD
jgi:ubiquitin C-terminal hydrolase